MAPPTLTAVTASTVSSARRVIAFGCTMSDYHKDLDAAKAHLQKVHWSPSKGAEGVPQNEQEMRTHVKMISDALKNTSGCADEKLYPEDFARFQPDGAYSGEDIEAIAWTLVEAVMRLHQYGATNYGLKPPHARPQPPDAGLSFRERIFKLMPLLSNYKSVADQIMRASENVDLFIAKPIETQQRMKTWVEQRKEKGKLRQPQPQGPRVRVKPASSK